MKLNFFLSGLLALSTINFASAYSPSDWKAILTSTPPPQPKDLVTPNVTAAIRDVRSLVQPMRSWVKTTAALDEHFIYDDNKHYVRPRGSSNITYKDLSFARPIYQTFLALVQHVEAAKTTIGEVEAHVEALEDEDLPGAKQYCDKWRGMSMVYPHDKKVDSAIHDAHRLNGLYHELVKSIAELDIFGWAIDSDLERLDQLLQMESKERKNEKIEASSFNDLFETRRTAAIKAVDANTGVFDNESLHQVKKLRSRLRGLGLNSEGTELIDASLMKISNQKLNLIILERLSPSFERAQASVQIACDMTKLDKETKMARLFQAVRDTVGW